MKNNPASLAEKIAKLIESEAQNSDVASLFATLEKINRRLDKLEQVQTDPASSITPLQSAHPSQDRFAVAEAIADALFDLKSKEKACTFEPNGKPCDHCAMCSSRGF
jgi:Asp-tRNA(Asn)/Glu-tRNA(Gln) amidotransferase C subunit